MTDHPDDSRAEAMIKVKHITKIYGGGEIALRALDDVSLTVHEGKFITVVGPSGCGKSTLMQILAGLAPATSGSVVIDGRPVAGPSPDIIGVMFQDAWLLPWKTAIENVEFPLALRGVTAAERRARALPLLELVGLLRSAHRYPDELSGGMRQRVAIAMGASRRQIMFQVLAPLALPAILSGLRLGTALIVIGVVLAEMLGSADGIGFWISYHRSLFNTGQVYLGIVLALLVAWLANKMLSAVERIYGRRSTDNPML